MTVEATIEQYEMRHTLQRLLVTAALHDTLDTCDRNTPMRRLSAKRPQWQSEPWSLNEVAVYPCSRVAV